MAPTTRSNRSENPIVVSSGITANLHNRGLTSLPNELYLEILSFLPAFADSYEWLGEKPDPYRQLTLYHLTQTCCSLRRFFLRYAWERIEAFGGMWSPNGKLSEKKLVQEILRQLETVTIRNPDLRKYVTTVDVTIPRYSHHAVISELAQSISLFPNVHTLRLIFQKTGDRPWDPERTVFSNFRYPTVHTLHLDSRSPYSDILQSCPNATHLSFHKDLCIRRRLIEAFEHRYAISVERLGMIKLLSPLLPEIAKSLPRLRDITLDCRTLSACTGLNYLSSIPLHTIRLRLDDSRLLDSNGQLTSVKHQTWIDMTKAILAKCPPSEVAKKVIVEGNNTVHTYRV